MAYSWLSRSCFAWVGLYTFALMVFWRYMLEGWTGRYILLWIAKFRYRLGIVPLLLVLRGSAMVPIEFMEGIHPLPEGSSVLPFLL